MKKSLEKAFLRNGILILLAAIIMVGALLRPDTALAWKTKTHGYSANLLLNDAADGFVTVDGSSYRIPEEYYTALTTYPDAFRAGALGPDFYPDMITGQMLVHPYDASQNVGSKDWLQLLVNQLNSMPKNSPERMEALAFTLGMAIHYAGDEFGHDFINAFAGGAFPSYAEAVTDRKKLFFIIRHMAEESHMDKLIGSEIGDTHSQAPLTFVLDTWVFNGSPDAGPAKIYDKYGGMTYQYKYLVEMREALHHFAEDHRDETIFPMPQIVAYVDAWVDDLDTATRGFVEAFDRIGNDFLTGAGGKGDIQIVTDRMNEWWDNYGAFCSPFPDFIVKISQWIGKTSEQVLEWLGLAWIVNAWNDFKLNLIKSAVLWGLEMFGFDYDEYKEYLEDVRKALMAEGGSEQDYLDFKAFMDAFVNDPESFEAFYNTLLMGRLILMGPEQLNSFLKAHGYTGPEFEPATGRLMMDSFDIQIHTKDGNFFDTYGTDDNVYVDVFENGTLICSRLLDKPNYNDFEMNDRDTYPVSLPRKVFPGDFSIALRLERAGLPGVDEWTPDEVKVTLKCSGAALTDPIRVLSSAYTFKEHGVRKNLPVPVDPSIVTYTTEANLGIIDYMLSCDASTQWVNDQNVLWTDPAGRLDILYGVFHGFKPEFRLQVLNVEPSEPGLDVYTFTEGDENAAIAADFHSFWNGITKERRDKELLVAEANESYQQACSGTVRLVTLDGEETVLTGTVANGDAYLKLNTLEPGVYRLKAEYDGDDYNGRATSENRVTLQVLPQGPWQHEYTVTLTANPTEGGTVQGSGEYAENILMHVLAEPAEGMEFVNWTEDGTVVSEKENYRFRLTGNRNLTANFKQKQCNVTFFYVGVEGGKAQVVKDENAYPYGTKKESIVQPTVPPYVRLGQSIATFRGWNPGLQDVKGDQAYWAEYTTEPIKYTIQFVDEDGRVLQSSMVPYGQMPEYKGIIPEKPGDEHYRYLFNGWEPAVSRVTGDAVYTALYSKYERQYEITFANYDGTVLQSSPVKYGELPVYSGATPVKPPEAGQSYFFAGWAPEIVKVTEPALYTAVFVPAVTLTFRDPLPDGASGIPDPMTINPSISRDVLIPDDIPQKSGRIFTGWNTAGDGSGTPYAPGSVITLAEDTTLWAQWELAGNSWAVVYNANGGTKAPRTQIVPQGQDAVLTTELPEAGRMVFRGWATDPEATAAEYQPGNTLKYDSGKTYVVLYALWSLDPAQRPVTISFNANGGLPDTVPKKTSAPKRTWVQLPAQQPSWDAQHDFLGWSADPKAAEPELKPGGTALFEQDTVLYAVWNPHYKVIEGAGSVWVRGSGKTQRFVADGNVIYFSKLLVDGQPFETGVKISSGSTVADISAKAMEALSDGEHTITFVYVDGEASAPFSVQRKLPPTGDRALPGLWCSLILLGIIGLGFAGRTARLKRRK